MSRSFVRPIISYDRRIGARRHSACGNPVASYRRSGEGTMTENRSPLGLRLAAAAGLLFLHLPLLFIILYAFTTEERSFEFPPPGYTLKWFGVAWNRPDVWAALGLSVKVALVVD